MMTELSQDTKSYRQKALAFVAKEGESSSIANCVSEALLRQHVGLHSVDAESGSQEATYLPTCPKCGGPIQPGNDGVSIRLVRQKALSRTQRRRLSRKTALRLKRVTQTNKSQSLALSLLGKIVLKEYPHLQQETEFVTPHTFNHELHTSKNHVVVQCTCHWKLTLPGCPRSRSSRNSQNAKKGGTKGEAVVPEKNGAKKAKEFSQQNDFISLGTLPKRKAANNEPKQTMPTGKKKKPKRSQLMDFLSSLNDR